MGWNQIFGNQGPIFQQVEEGDYLYFVHSYYVATCDYTVSTCNYGINFSNALQKDNFFAVQPHPEKSAASGIKILSNFLSLTA